jgi:CHAD domain-containing protein
LWQTLGALRDHDVAATDTLPRWGTAFVQAADAPAEREQRQAAVTQAVAQLRRASSHLRGHARRLLAQPATGAAWLALLAWVHGLPGSVAAEPDWAMQRLARWHRRWQRLLRAAQAPDAPIERVHEARLRAKRLRYAAEAVASAMRARDARQLRQWQREGSTWQAHIGTMRDLQRCAQLLRKHRGASDLLGFLQGAAHAWPGSAPTTVLA